MWKGWLPSVIGVVPYVGLNFAVYETLKDVVLKLYGARPVRSGFVVLVGLVRVASGTSCCVWMLARPKRKAKLCQKADPAQKQHRRACVESVGTAGLRPGNRLLL